MRSLLACLALLASGAWTVASRGAETVPIHIESTGPATRYHLFTTTGRLVDSCVGNCTFEVPRASYVVVASENDEMLGGRVKFDAIGPTTLRVDPTPRSTRYFATGMQIAGGVLVFSGIVWALSGSRCNAPCMHEDPEADTRKTGVMAMLIGGLLTSAAGTVMLVTMKTRIDVERPELSLSLAPARGGGFAGLRLQF